MKYVPPLVLVIPMPFLFHFIEITFNQGSTYAFTGTFFFIVVAGLLSVGSKLALIFVMAVISNLLSIVLGRQFIIPPNGSWFNPFGMEFAIVFVGMIILIGILIIRYVVSVVLSRPEK